MTTTDMTTTDLTGTGTPSVPSVLGAEADAQRERLVALRRRLLAEQAGALSPAVARALEMADAYLFLALGYVGHTEELFPGEAPGAAPGP
ncbi:hypothetical protein ACVGVM_12890 [Pseudonocardia bannensis]|uniref:Uncharacterized protein n=1 Tax=Pseudonocardia bannensis TaxID=630973 RepID=A0A848DKW0_9PSEU|nr:hypothetical protein [Pseudonocardia bannensis]NMH93101.1 hypothetical protein [Pseudonocardia bannensis]